MQQDNLHQMFSAPWPKVRLHLDGHLELIHCAYQYSACYETGFIVLLDRYSRPRQLSPDMEHIFGMRRSKLSAIIQTFSTALYIMFLCPTYLIHQYGTNKCRIMPI